MDVDSAIVQAARKLEYGLSTIKLEGSVTPRFYVRDSESTWIHGGFLDS